MNAQEILSTLTRYEKARLLTGDGSWHIYDCHGKLPRIMMSDGPHGLRKQDFENFADINHSEIATCFPTASAIACSWNPDTVRRMAGAIAQEAKKEQVSIVLGCGTNIKRSPLCGRNFEYFSEDPFLSGSFAAAYISAMENEGVGTSLKHFAANNQETRRQTVNSMIDEQTLHEIYLTPFEMAVKHGKPSTVMGAYNRLNGEYACANHFLLTELLREKWGFDGTVISDWGATMDIVKCIKAGMNLEMPDSYGFHTKQLLDAVEQGLLTEEELDNAALNLIQLVLKLSRDNPSPETASSKNNFPSVDAASSVENNTVDYQKQHEIARELEEDCAVLLKSSGVLPLSCGAKVLVVGDMAAHMRFQGGGSSHITTNPTRNAVEALQEQGFSVIYQQGYHQDSSTPDSLLEEKALQAASEDIPVLYFCGLTDRFESEGYDRKTLDIPENQLALLQKLVKVNHRIAAITFGGAPMNLSFASTVSDILHMYLGGQAVGEACANLISGKVNPSGKLAETFPLSLAEVPNHSFYAGESDDVPYREGLFVGYRYYETFHRPVQFEFGYGLSYTSFSYSNLRLSPDRLSAESREPLCLHFTVKNTGTRRGKEIAQVYVKNPEGNLLRPALELRGYTKLSLEPGEEKEATILLTAESFRMYDRELHDFVVPSGQYTIAVGASCRDLRLQASLPVKGVEITRNDRQLYPEYFNADFSEKAFQKLYGQPFSHFDRKIRGEYTVYDSFERVTKQSLFGRATKRVILSALRIMNRKLKKDDPAYLMVVQGLREGPLDSLVSTSGGVLKPNITEALVLHANKRYFKGFCRILAGNRK